MIQKNNIPKHWQLKKLEELLVFVIGGDWGKDPSLNDPNYETAYCIRGSEIKDWEVLKGRTASLRKIKKTSLETRTLKEGDILVEISGGGPEQPVGRTVLIDKTVLSFNPAIPKICTNFFRLIRPIKGIDSKFLHFYLILFYFSGEVVRYQAGSNNLRNLKFSDYVKIEIPLPPLPEQQAIVAKIEELFSELDKGVESLKTAQQQLKVYRQSLLKWAFEGRLTSAYFDKAQHEPLSGRPRLLSEAETSGNMAAEEKEKYGNNELPEGWIETEIKNVCLDIKVGIVIKPTNFYSKTGKGIKAFRSANVRELKINDADWVYFTKEANEINHRTKLNFGDVLIVRSGYPGTSCIVSKEFEGCNAIDILIATPNKEKILPEYLCYFNNSPLGKGLFILKSRGVAQKHLNVGEYSKLVVHIPSLKEQQRIVDELESRLTVCDKIEKTINEGLQQSEALRQSILKRAFEGRLV
ncbi:MAG: restriction endonuclease subunit S [Bacteroidales bacterium]|nr:restriction endonuclease subunit S [Bacteroidales bacterium]